MEIGLKKVVCIHGLRLTNMLDLTIKYRLREVDITFLPYEKFQQVYSKDEFLNYEDLCDCDMVAIISCCENNTVEIQIIKMGISVIYFATRLVSSERCHNMFFKNNPHPSVRRYHDYFANYEIDGYWDIEFIQNASWYVNIGKNPLQNDSFERWATRIYGNKLGDSFERRDGFHRRDRTVIIEVDYELHNWIKKILYKVNKNDIYSLKLQTSLRLYYEILCNFKNPDYTVILYCTIFETILLNKAESNQRKKVATRSACIVCDKLEIKHKKFVANQVYFFYKYRNNIIHDGLGLMDFEDEVLFNSVLNGMKSIIFTLVKAIIVNDFVSPQDVKEMVIKNQKIDKKSNAFDYIDHELIDSNSGVQVFVFYE